MLAKSRTSPADAGHEPALRKVSDMTTMWLHFVCLGLALTLAPLPALADQSGPAAPPPVAPDDQALDEDLRVVPAEPDFALATLPTTLRVPAGRYVFRLTHRFARPIGDGNAGDFFSDLFGLDSGAQIGFELRYGLRPGTQVLLHRTSDRTIQFLGQHELLRQTPDQDFTVQAVVGLEGRNNFGLSDEIAIADGDVFSAALGVVVSHRFDTRGAVYAQPLVVLNANVDPARATTDEHTLLLGLGARWQLGDSRTYVLVEVAPRLFGYDAGVDHISLAIEKRYGGHVFQFNVSNSLATTLGQLSRGGTTNDNWYIGFNLTRKFY